MAERFAPWNRDVFECRKLFEINFIVPYMLKKNKKLKKEILHLLNIVILNMNDCKHSN